MFSIISDDWGTQNAKVKHLIRVLQEAALYEAADYISVNVLQKGKVQCSTLDAFFSLSLNQSNCLKSVNLNNRKIFSVMLN